MGSCQGENSIMIESSGISGRMTGIAGRTVISISTYPAMGIIRFGFIIMRVAVDAGKYSIVGRIRMAIGALIPNGTIVFPGINGEVSIMNCKLGGFPTGVCSMTIGTGCR